MIAAEHVQVISLELASLAYLPGDTEAVALLNVLVEELLRDFPQVSVVVRYADNLHISVYPKRGWLSSGFLKYHSSQRPANSLQVEPGLDGVKDVSADEQASDVEGDLFRKSHSPIYYTNQPVSSHIRFGRVMFSGPHQILPALPAFVNLESELNPIVNGC
jgi:hypothetical protein